MTMAGTTRLPHSDPDRVVRIVAVVAMATALLALFGWIFDIDALKGIAPGFVTMKANTAFCLLASGAALWMLRWEDRRAGAVRIAAGFVALLGGLSFLESAFHLDFGIDQLLFADTDTEMPGRMSPVTAMGFMLVAASLLLAGSKRGRSASQWVALAVGLIGLLGYICYVYEASAYLFGARTRMALHTALNFAALCFGLLAIHPDIGPTSVVLSRHGGGALARRFLPVAVLLPMVVGWLRLLGQRAGWYNTETGVAIFSITLIVMLCGLILFSAAKSNRLAADRERATREVAQSARHRQLALDAARMGWWHYDPVTRMAYWDERYREIFGVTGSGQANDEILKLLHPDDLPSVWAAVEAALNPVNPKPYAIEYRVNRPDGTMRWVEAHGLAIFEGEDAARHATSFVGTVADVTNRKRADAELRQKEERLRFALDVIETGEWDLDLIDHSAHRSLQHDRIFGYDTLLPEWTYEMFLDHVVPEDRGEVDRKFREAMATRGNWRFECRIRRRDGEHRWILASGRHIVDAGGQPRRMIGIVQDITDRKRAEQEIRILNATLEHRVLERTEQLATANRELEAFSYSVSHDLRAPLRAVDGYARILAEDHVAGLDDEGRRVLEVIRREANRMGRLIDDLLAFSRMSRQAMVAAEIDMAAMAQAEFDRCVAEAPGRDIRFTLHPLPPAYGDPTMLRQVWMNLIANAVKYTGKRAVAEIEIGAGNGHGECCYYVRDNGSGFDMKYAHKLFGVFQRLHADAEFEGTGVGLALAQRIVARHGGRIWAEGKIDGGAVFHFALRATKD